MKKILLISFLWLTVLSLSACGGGDDEPHNSETPEQTGGNDESDNPDTQLPGSEGRYLVLYASRSSNTGRVAQLIRTTLDCDILEIEPATPYDTDYNAMLDRAQKELAAIGQGNYPAIKNSVESFDSYDIIFIGYPIWFGSIATPMQSFMHSHSSKLSGKQIALFATSGSSGISSSVSEARSLCPGANFREETLLLTSSTLSQMNSRVPEWLEKLGARRENHETAGSPAGSSLNVNITVGGRTIGATMEDNAAARDLISRLPLEITLNDYNNTTEKIFYPAPALNTEGVTRGCAPVPGDITIYAPWGNVAIFCKNWSHSNDLIKIGHIDGDGISELAVSGDVRVRIERK